MIISVLAVFSLAGCGDDSTEGMTFITYYPELTLENSADGGTTLYCAKGGTFTDPGYTAILNGEDVTDQVQVDSNVNMDKSGIYTVAYSIVNADGFVTTASRKVIVTDQNDPVEGVYYVDPASYRVSSAGETPYGASYEMTVFNNGNGTYAVSDLLGGWYDKRANYGIAYSMPGDIKVSEDDSIEMLSSSVAGWGDSADYMKEGKFDSATNTLSWQVGYAGSMDFYVTMTKR